MSALHAQIKLNYSITQLQLCNIKFFRHSTAQKTIYDTICAQEFHFLLKFYRIKICISKVQMNKNKNFLRTEEKKMF